MPMAEHGVPEIPPQQENPENGFNDEVWVKITPEGERTRDEYYQRLKKEMPPIEKDAEGWTKIQLHEVAHLFGSQMYNGNPHLPIGITFRTKAPGEKSPEAIKKFNDDVLVKITPAGEQVRREYFTKLRIDTPAIQRDDEGWTKMQLREVLHLFGAKMHNGNPNLPIEYTFRI